MTLNTFYIDLQVNNLHIFVCVCAYERETHVSSDVIHTLEYYYAFCHPHKNNSYPVSPKRLIVWVNPVFRMSQVKLGGKHTVRVDIDIGRTIYSVDRSAIPWQEEGEFGIMVRGSYRSRFQRGMRDRISMGISRRNKSRSAMSPSCNDDADNSSTASDMPTRYKRESQTPMDLKILELTELCSETGIKREMAGTRNSCWRRDCWINVDTMTATTGVKASDEMLLLFLWSESSVFSRASICTQQMKSQKWI